MKWHFIGGCGRTGLVCSFADWLKRLQSDRCRHCNTHVEHWKIVP